MKKSFILFYFFARIGVGQSLTLSPTANDNLLIEKQGGTASLTLKGTKDQNLLNGSSGNSSINMYGEPKNFGSSENSINFFNLTNPSARYAIKYNYNPSNLNSPNKFGIYYDSTPIFLYGNNTSSRIETVAQTISSQSISQLILANIDNLDNGVNSSVHFKSNNLFTGAIKTTGIDPSTAKLSFYTGSSNSQDGLLERVSILDNGKVGIGINSVATNEKMEVNGRLRLRKDTFTSGLWLNNAVNGTAITDGAFIGLSNDVAGSEKVGFWLNGNYRWEVDRAGNAILGGGLNIGGRLVSPGGLSVGGGETIVKIMKKVVSYDLNSLSPGISISAVIPVNGVLIGDNIIFNTSQSIGFLGIKNCNVNLDGFITIVFENSGGTTIDLPLMDYIFTIYR